MVKYILLTGYRGFIGSYFKQITSFKIQNFSFQNDNIQKIDFKNISTIVHLGALVHQMNGAKEDDYFNINHDKTLQLAQKAKDNGVNHFIFISTVKVYGEENIEQYSENSPCNPVDSYGKSKLMAEKSLLNIESDTFKVSIIRTPIVYGEGVKANIYKLIELVENHHFLPFANIYNRRSMVYIGNLSSLIETVIKQEARGIFLASDNEPISTTYLIKKIADVMEKKTILFSSSIVKLAVKTFKKSIYQRLYENLYVDNTLTKERLNFTNPYSFEDGIKNMVKWYQKK